MFCPKCGKQIEDDSQFCSFCGCSLKEILGDNADGLDEKSGYTALKSNTDRSETEEKPKSGRAFPKKVIVSSVIVLTAAAVVFSAIVLVNHFRSENVPTVSENSITGSETVLSTTTAAGDDENDISDEEKAEESIVGQSETVS